MLLAIDVGNTDTKFGVHHNGTWMAVWRRATQADDAEILTAWLTECFSRAEIAFGVEGVACASVVPGRDASIAALGREAFGKEVFFLTAETVHGLEIAYDPPESLGADRIANALGALAQYPPPLVVIDFGSATTFDVVVDRRFVGGAILPGVALQIQSLVGGTAQLPSIPLSMPVSAIGGSTVGSLQSGIVLGHVGAVEGLARRISAELEAKPTVIATGGLSHLFIGATEAIDHFVPMLTLDGIVAGFPN